MIKGVNVGGSIGCYSPGLLVLTASTIPLLPNPNPSPPSPGNPVLHCPTPHPPKLLFLPFFHPLLILLVTLATPSFPMPAI